MIDISNEHSLTCSRRDAITKAYRLSFPEFKPSKSTKKVGDITIIEYVVRHPRTDLILGYITFAYDKDKEGELEITNYGSSLEPWHLQMAGTTKCGDPLQSGKHGEGLKRAIATFRRKPNHHTVRIVSSKFNWSFGWDSYGMLNLNLSRIKPQKLENERKKIKGKPRDTKFRFFEDGVSIIIGQRHQKFCQAKEYTGNKIRLEEFEKMVNISSIILERPESFITPVGSIILPPEYRNKLYNDGLLVQRIGQDTAQMPYGYDFHNAPTALDRTVFRDPAEMTAAVNNIWANACRRDSNMMSSYTDLILNNRIRLPDVSSNTTSDFLAEDIARLVWAELLSRKCLDSGSAPFFYVEGDNFEVSITKISVGAKVITGNFV